MKTTPQLQSEGSVTCFVCGCQYTGFRGSCPTCARMHEQSDKLEYEICQIGLTLKEWYDFLIATNAAVPSFLAPPDRAQLRSILKQVHHRLSVHMADY